MKNVMRIVARGQFLVRTRGRRKAEVNNKDNNNSNSSKRRERRAGLKADGGANATENE